MVLGNPRGLRYRKRGLHGPAGAVAEQNEVDGTSRLHRDCCWSMVATGVPCCAGFMASPWICTLTRADGCLGSSADIYSLCRQAGRGDYYCRSLSYSYFKGVDVGGGDAWNAAKGAKP